jgi:TatD DNase family protein
MQMIFDTHAHYDDRQFEEDREELLDSMRENGVELIVDAGSDIASWDKIEQLTDRYPFIYGAIGVHPDEVGELDEEKMKRMEQLLAREKMVAVGEIGLDYYWDKENRDLPVIIHSREAAADTMEIMKQYAGELSGVIHCFSYSPEQAKEYVKMGFYLGIGGVVTFKNAKKLKEVVQEIPLESLVLETDSPYLAPVPNRGKRNSSLNLVYVAEEIAGLKGISYEEVVRQTTENAKKLYRFKK